MELIRGIYNLSNKHRGSVVTIGNFDGVHLGHQALIKQLVAMGKKRCLPVVVVMFEPQPQEFFLPTHPPARITTLRDKYKQLSELGVDYLLCIRFDCYFAEITAEQFISTLLLYKLAVHYLIVGDDFCFGKHRQGDFSLLRKMADKHHFQLVKAPIVRLDQQRVSSTLVRDLLQKDHLADAARFLGRPYAISGRVIYGRELGRTLGFPTANIRLNRLISPVNGVYAVMVEYNQQQFYGMANIGYRPTIAGSELLLEVHLFNFNEDLYGKYINVILCQKLREEKKFANLTELTLHIEQDKIAAQTLFNINP